MNWFSAAVSGGLPHRLCVLYSLSLCFPLVPRRAYCLPLSSPWLLASERKTNNVCTLLALPLLLGAYYLPTDKRLGGVICANGCAPLSPFFLADT